MGNTVWVLAEGQEEDDFDHSLILREDKKLDRLAQELGVTKLSDLLDFSILAEEFGGPDKANIIEATDAIDTLSTLISAIQGGHKAYSSKRRDEVLEELQDCLAKCRDAEAKGLKVRLSVVP